MSVTLINLYKLNQTPAELLEAMQNWKLIPKEGSYLCPKCSGKLTLNANKKDGWRWHCNNKISQRKQKAEPCGCRVRLRTGTFFANSHMSYFSVLAFAHLWAGGIQLRVIKLELEIGSDETLVNWASFCREVLFGYALKNGQP